MPADYTYEPYPQPPAPPPEFPPPEPPPAPTPWTFKNLLLLAAFTPAALFAANLIALALYTLLGPRLGRNPSGRELADNPFFLLAFQTLFYAFLFLFIYLLVAVISRQPFWEALRWRRLRVLHALGAVAGGILVAEAIRLTPPILPESESFPLERLFTSPQAGYAIGAFAILVAPFMEELLFRGVLFAVFENRVGLRFAVFTTAALFAGLHVPEYWRAWNHVLMILVVGLVFSLARGLSGSLTPSVLLHVGYNAGMMLGLYFETQHFRTLSQLLAH